MQKELYDFNKRTSSFVNKIKEFNYYTFTEFIIQDYSTFEDPPDGLRVYSKDAVISKNQKYNASINRLGKLYFNEKQKKKYEENNFNDFKNVEHLF